MLTFERLHVLLKSLARGSKDKLRSLALNYDLYDEAQTDWRLDPSIEWAVAPNPSTFAGARSPQSQDGLVITKGAGKPAVLGTDDFTQMQELWAQMDKPFDYMYDRFLNDKTKPPGATLASWDPKHGRRLNEDELRWKTMTNQIEVHPYIYESRFLMYVLYIHSHVLIIAPSTLRTGVPTSGSGYCGLLRQSLLQHKVIRRFLRIYSVPRSGCKQRASHSLRSNPQDLRASYVSRLRRRPRCGGR